MVNIVKKTAKTGEAQVSKVKKKGKEVVSEEHHDEPTQPVVVAERHATVGVNQHVTINTGNFESVKLGVFLSMPCDVDDVEDCYEATKEWVDAKLEEMAGEVYDQMEDVDDDE